MKMNVRFRAATLGVAALATAIAVPQMALADRSEITASPPAPGRIPDRDAEARLNKPQFNSVTVTVEDGIATLTARGMGVGHTSTYSDVFQRET